MATDPEPEAIIVCTNFRGHTVIVVVDSRFRGNDLIVFFCLVPEQNSFIAKVFNCTSCVLSRLFAGNDRPRRELSIEMAVTLASCLAGYREVMQHKGRKNPDVQITTIKKALQPWLKMHPNTVTSELIHTIKHDDLRNVSDASQYKINQFKKATPAFVDIARNDMRRTSATLLMANNVQIEKIAKILGHSSPVVTLKHYAHTDANQINQALECLA